ncbi:hypothetical protein M5K25_017951 [Dendrobium thyrsiflorum]|uniref:Uncharacterized protein n=1 Tax=Dendrobium thyrsiflorum TaxID=117978 RepID=A0ABD0UGR5_DENTH
MLRYTFVPGGAQYQFVDYYRRSWLRSQKYRVPGLWKEQNKAVGFLFGNNFRI